MVGRRRRFHEAARGWVAWVWNRRRFLDHVGRWNGRTPEGRSFWFANLRRRTFLQVFGHRHDSLSGVVHQKQDRLCCGGVPTPASLACWGSEPKRMVLQVIGRLKKKDWPYSDRNQEEGGPAGARTPGGRSFWWPNEEGPSCWCPDPRRMVLLAPEHQKDGPADIRTPGGRSFWFCAKTSRTVRLVPVPQQERRSTFFFLPPIVDPPALSSTSCSWITSWVLSGSRRRRFMPPPMGFRSLNVVAAPKKHDHIEKECEG